MINEVNITVKEFGQAVFIWRGAELGDALRCSGSRVASPNGAFWPWKLGMQELTQLPAYGISLSGWRAERSGIEEGRGEKQLQSQLANMLGCW